MKAILILLMGWIGAHSQYQTNDLPLPEVVELSKKALTAEFYSESPKDIPENGVDGRLKAIYNFDDGASGTIYILAAESVEGAEHYEDPRDNPIWREMLLHELIHHVQWQNGAPKNWPCHKHGEREAYLLGGKFLKNTYVDDPITNRGLLAYRLSRC